MRAGQGAGPPEFFPPHFLTNNTPLTNAPLACHAEEQAGEPVASLDPPPCTTVTNSPGLPAVQRSRRAS